jgi:hypothetical protein
MWLTLLSPMAMIPEVPLARAATYGEGSFLAENETLTVDRSTASRWSGVRQRIASGEPLRECLGDIEKQFYRSLRSEGKIWENRGVSLKHMLETALERPNELEALVWQVGNTDHARILLDIARHQGFLSLEPLLSAWLTRAWESIRTQLQLDIAYPIPDPDFEDGMSAMLDRLARLMAGNPSRVPSLPRRSEQQPGGLEKVLNRSLLHQEVIC